MSKVWDMPAVGIIAVAVPVAVIAALVLRIEIDDITGFFDH